MHMNADMHTDTQNNYITYVFLKVQYFEVWVTRRKLRILSKYGTDSSVERFTKWRLLSERCKNARECRAYVNKHTCREWDWDLHTLAIMNGILKYKEIRTPIDLSFPEYFKNNLGDLRQKPHSHEVSYPRFSKMVLHIERECYMCLYNTHNICTHHNWG